jgi:hypothetical protein
MTALTMEAVSTLKTPVNFYQTTRYNIQVDCHLHKEFFELDSPGLWQVIVTDFCENCNEPYDSIKSEIFSAS